MTARNGKLWIAGSLIAAFLTAGQASGQPFKVDFGTLVKSKGTLEVFKSGDEKPIITETLGGNRIVTLDFPTEGLYTVQIKTAKKLVWQETVFVLLQKPDPENLLKASWAQSSGTLRTVLRVQNPDGEMGYGISIREKIFLRLRAVPRLIRVFREDYYGNTSPAAEVAMGPINEKQAKDEGGADEGNVQIDFGGSDDDQAAYEPEYKGLLSGKEDKSWRQKILDLASQRRVSSMHRQHRVYGWLRMMQESFTVHRKTDTYNGAKSQGFGTGFGGDYVFKDTLSLQLEVDTHGTKTEYEKGGSNPPAEEQKRIHVKFGPLLDVFNSQHEHPKHAIEIGPQVGYLQIPLEKDNQGKIDFGGSLRYQYFGSSHTEVQVRFMQSHSYDLSATWTGGDSMSLAGVNPLFGVYKYRTEFDEAEANSKFDETGIRFGINKSF